MFERLTHRSKYGIAYTKIAVNESNMVDVGECYTGRIIDRLAAYEDIGLSPEEITDMIYRFEAFLSAMTGSRMSKSNYTLDAMISAANEYQQSLCDECWDRSELAKYYELEHEGRLVVLPCKEVYTKAGDTLYLIDGGEIIEVTHCGAEISPSGEIYVVVAAEDKIFPFRQPDPENDLDPTDWCTETKEVMLDDFGKTVFLTREEAEKALEVGGE